MSMIETLDGFIPSDEVTDRQINLRRYVPILAVRSAPPGAFQTVYAVKDRTALCARSSMASLDRCLVACC